MSSKNSLGDKYVSARFISQENEISCMAFENPISDWKYYYENELTGKTSWLYSYYCPDDDILSWVIPLGILAFAAFMATIIYKIYEHNKKSKEMQQGSYHNNTVSN